MANKQQAVNLSSYNAELVSTLEELKQQSAELQQNLDQTNDEKLSL